LFDERRATGQQSNNDNDNNNNKQQQIKKIIDIMNESKVDYDDDGDPEQQRHQRQSYIYALQDTNSDLQKRIHSLEIAFRDHGFDKDGKQILIANKNNNCDGGKVEMMSMMGMDAERPTVLCKYFEYKVVELQEDYEKIEFECDELREIVRTLTDQQRNDTTGRLSKEIPRGKIAVNNIQHDTTFPLTPNNDESLNEKEEETHKKMKEQIEKLKDVVIDESSQKEILQKIMKEQIEKLQQQLKDVVIDESSEKELLQQQLKDFTNESSKKELLLQQEVGELEKKIKELMQNNSVRVQELERDLVDANNTENNKSEQDRLNGVIVELLKEVQTTVQKSESKCEHLTSCILELEKELDVTAKENETLKENLTTSISTIAEIEAKNHSDDHNESIQQKKEMEIKTLSDRYTTLEKELQVSKDDNERIAFLSEEEKQSLVKTIDDERKKIDILEEECSTLKHDLKVYIDENKELSLQNESLVLASVAVTENNDQEISLTCRVAELEQEIESIIKENEELSLQNEQYHSREDSKEANIHEYEKEIEILDDDDDDDDDDADDDDDDEIKEQYRVGEDPKEADSHHREKEIEILDDDDDDGDDDSDNDNDSRNSNSDSDDGDDGDGDDDDDDDDDDDEIKEQYHVREDPKEADSHHRDKEIEILDDDDDDGDGDDDSDSDNDSRNSNSDSDSDDDDDDDDDDGERKEQYHVGEDPKEADSHHRDKEIEILDDDDDDGDGDEDEDEDGRRDESLSLVSVASNKDQETSLTCRVAELEQEIESITKENKELSLQNESLLLASVAVTENKDREISRTCCRVAELEQEIESITMTNAKEQEHFINHVADLNKTLELIAKRNESNPSETELYEAQNMKSEHAEQEQESLNDRIVELEQQLESIVEKNQKEQESAMSHVANVFKELELRTKKIESLSSEIELYEADKIKNEQDQESLTCRIVELEQEGENSTEQDDLLHQLATLENDLDFANATNVSLSSKIKSYEEEKNEFESKIDRLIQQVAALEEDLESYEEEKNDFESEIDHLTQEVEDLESYEVGKDKFESEIDRLLQQVAALENDLESANASKIKSYEEEKEELESTVEKNRTELDCLIQQVATLENDLESANASKIKSYEEEKEELESTVENSSTELDCLMKELVAYEEVKGEHEQLIDRVSNLEDELQSSLERNDQLSTDIESLKILKEENKNDTERVSDVITDDDVLSLESDTINTENLIITGTRSISEGREDPGGTLEYSNFSPRKSPQNMDEDLGTVLSRASLSRSGTMNPTEDLKIGKSEDVSNNPIADGDIDSQNKLVEKYLYPLVDKAEAELDEAIPNDIVQGIYDALFLVLHVERESISVLGWEDFESILEEVCQEYDAETWFQIQEAFFAAWEQLDESNKSLLELSEVSESWCNFDTTTQ
jgi:hypothetical protein